MLALMLLPLSASAQSISAESEIEENATSSEKNTSITEAYDAPTEDYIPTENSQEGTTNLGDIPKEETEDTNTKEEENGQENTNNSTADKEDNPFEVFYNFVAEHAGEIFSLLSFISAALVALLYNKGLLPALRNSLSTMANILSGVKDSTEKNETVSAEMRQELLEKLGIAEGGLQAVSDSLTTLTERLDKLTDSKNEQEKMRLIMNAQIDMLYEIFLCSSLPEYQKEAVRKKMAAMKEVLGSEKQETAD